MGNIRAPRNRVNAAAKKWIKRLLKLAVCAGALWYLSDKVTLRDRVRLKSDPTLTYRVVEESAESFRVLTSDGAERTVPRDELATPDQLAPLGKGLRPVERGMASIARSADWSWGLWALAAWGPVTFIVAWRLQRLLATQDISISLRDSLLLTFAGNFFNFAMPGTTGGDLYKAYHISRMTHKRTEGVTVVILDRVLGLVSFLLIAAVTILVYWRTNLIGFYGRWVGILTVAFFVACGLFFSRRVRHWVRYDDLLRRLPFADKLKRVDATTFSFRYHRWDAVLSLVSTMLSHVFIIFCVYFAARALGMHPHNDRSDADLLVACMLATVVGMLLAAVPISIQGFGLMEAVFYKVLVEGGWSSASQMLALTLSFRLIQVVWSLPGVVVPWLGFGRPPERELEALSSKTPT